MRLIIFSDGASRGNPGPAAAGAVLQNEAEEIVGTVSRFLGSATNNQAEYAALILALKKAHELRATELMIFLDSKLIVEQISGRWKIKDLQLKKAAEKVHTLLKEFNSWQIQHVFREKNKKADMLANQALNARGFKKSAFP